ncbi:GNAT family N-acetyltransferase [Reyranella sp.]|uniref:GNAT family N-acetyltransferase n=1 Tax=Reyranella sp. TaxID=1929291 RepID=UPI002732184B|nr:GNAT family N-acetyltransferase [Reyranella sp.]MDP2375913.1 GNAT family N-acetyltransferase [Reyranella sp.]
MPPASLMPPTPMLQTPRLVLRPVRSKDAPVIQRRFPHWEVVRWLNARIPWPYPANGAAAYVAACLEEMARGEKSHWAIIPKSGPADLIGIIDLWPDDGVSRSQRGFWLDPEFQGKGLMTEAAERVTQYALCDLGWPHLWLTNAQDNHPSRRIKEKQGARLVDLMIGEHVGGRGPQMVWLLRREDWLARRADTSSPTKALAAS